MNDAARPLICHVIHRLDHGGLENGLVNLVNRLPAGKYRHAVVCLAGIGGFRRRIERQDATVHDLGKRPGKDPAAYLRFWRLLRDLRPAVVHTRNLGTVDLQWIAAAAGVTHRIHGEHGWYSADPEGRSLRAIRIRRWCRPVIGQYVTVSRDLASWLEQRIGVPADRIRHICNGVDTGRFRPEGPVPADLPWARAEGRRPLVVGAIGRLDPIKCYASLIRAVAALRSRMPPESAELRLVIAGDGPERRALEAELAGAGLAEIGWMAGMREDIPDLLRAIDIFVLPSSNEGISNTILEAMATGRAVIATAVGGNPELVEQDVTGLLVPPGSVEDLAAALESLAADPARRRALGAAGRERAVGRFSLDSMVAGYEQLYDRLFNLGRESCAA